LKSGAELPRGLTCKVPARAQFRAALPRHGRFGILLPGVEVALVETQPDVKANEGTSLTAILRRTRKERGLLQRIYPAKAAIGFECGLLGGSGNRR
jgi:hypothetical protein